MAKGRLQIREKKVYHTLGFRPPPPWFVVIDHKEIQFSLMKTLTFEFPQSQTTVMKSQQDRIENNNALADDLKSQLSQAESKLATLQGKNDRK